MNYSVYKAMYMYLLTQNKTSSSWLLHILHSTAGVWFKKISVLGEREVKRKKVSLRHKVHNRGGRKKVCFVKKMLEPVKVFPSSSIHCPWCAACLPGWLFPGWDRASSSQTLSRTLYSCNSQWLVLQRGILWLAGDSGEWFLAL